MSRLLHCLNGEPSAHVIRTLRERIDLLEEQVRQYRDAAEAVETWPAEWKLTRYEGRLLAALVRCRSSYAPTERLLVAMYGQEPDVATKIVDVFVCKLRKKLKPLGVEIQTRWGEGYALTPAGAATLRRLAAISDPIAEERAALAARVAELERENARLTADLGTLTGKLATPSPVPARAVRWLRQGGRRR